MSTPEPLVADYAVTHGQQDTRKTGYRGLVYRF